VDDATSKVAVTLISAPREFANVISMPIVANRTGPSRAGWFTAWSFEQ
jgi:hypothetical protein